MSMKIISLVTQKGGSGKSTLCVSLAVAAQDVGRRVCILETDKQATVSQWARERRGKEPEVGPILADKLDETLEQLRTADYDFVFIDTPGIDSPGTHAAIRVADLCILPCRPTPLDLRAMRPTIEAVHRMGKDFAFVLNQAPAKSFRVRDTLDALTLLGVVAPAPIVMRNDHQDAIGRGLGVTEFGPTSPAADEIRLLWDWIYHRTRNLGHVRPAA
jgi:chromosome partitioning protein